MKNIFRDLSYLIMALMFTQSVNAVNSIDTKNILLAEQWDLSRNGDALVRIPVINKVINQWSLKPSQRIELHFPGGEEGELWVGELSDWLVSLGVPSKNIVVVPGSGMEDVIRLYVVKIGESFK